MNEDTTQLRNALEASRFPTREDFKDALESLRQQLKDRYPTREDIDHILAASQEQIDRRFESAKEVNEAQLKRIDAERVDRDKAVDLLKAHSMEQIRIGDENLRQHIENQFNQITTALNSAEALEQARIAALDDKVNQLNSSGHQMIEAKIKSVGSEVAIINAASEKAILKAEANVKERLDDASKTDENLRQLASSAMPRHEVIALVSSNSEKISALTDRLNRNEGRGAGLNQGWGLIVAGVGVVGTISAMLIGLVIWMSSLSPKVSENRALIDNNKRQLDQAVQSTNR